MYIKLILIQTSKPYVQTSHDHHKLYGFETFLKLMMPNNLDLSIYYYSIPFITDSTIYHTQNISYTL